MNDLTSALDALELHACSTAGERIAAELHLGTQWDGTEITNAAVRAEWRATCDELDKLGIGHEHLDHYLDRARRESGIDVPRTYWWTTTHQDGAIRGRWAQTAHEAAIVCAMDAGPLTAIYQDDNASIRARLDAERKAQIKAEITGDVTLW